MNITPQIVTDEGDINLHNKSGAVIAITFRDDETGELRDVSGRTIYFVTNTGVRIALTNGSLGIKVLTLAQQQLSGLLNKPGTFVVVDETDAVHEVHWEGRITVRGWA